MQVLIVYLQVCSVMNQESKKGNQLTCKFYLLVYNVIESGVKGGRSAKLNKLPWGGCPLWLTVEPWTCPTTADY